MKNNIYILVIFITVLAICVLDFYENSLNFSASLDLKISEKSGIQETSTILPCLNREEYVQLSVWMQGYVFVFLAYIALFIEIWNIRNTMLSS